MGLNLYLSELVSDLAEPMVETIEGGAEVISCEDMLPNVENLNDDMDGWHKGWS